MGLKESKATYYTTAKNTVFQGSNSEYPEICRKKIQKLFFTADNLMY